MSSNRSVTIPWTIALAFALGPGGPVAAVEKQAEKLLAEEKADLAVAYFIRPSSMVGAARTLFIYSDDRLLGTLNKGSYTFAYLEPGVHLLWTNWTRVTREVDLAPGRVYYFNMWPRAGMSGNFDMLSEAEGQRWIEKVKRYLTPGDKEVATAQKHIENRFGKAQRREAKKAKGVIADVAPLEEPVDTSGMIRVPAGTEVRVELLETVSSRFNQPGDSVWLQVVRDLEVDGQIVVRGGTFLQGGIRQAQKGKSRGLSLRRIGGQIDVRVPGVPAVDGTLIPTAAQLIAEGKDRWGSQVVPFYGYGVRGREGFVLAGEELEAVTRQDAWIHPSRLPTVRLDSSVRAGIIQLDGQVSSVVNFAPKKRRPPEDVVIYLQSGQRIASLQVVALADQFLPEPLPVSATLEQQGGWACSFDGWSLIRFMKPAAEVNWIPISLAGRLADGAEFEASVTAQLVVDTAGRATDRD